VLPHTVLLIITTLILSLLISFWSPDNAHALRREAQARSIKNDSLNVGIKILRNDNDDAYLNSIDGADEIGEDTAGSARRGVFGGLGAAKPWKAPSQVILIDLTKPSCFSPLLTR